MTTSKEAMLTWNALSNPEVKNCLNCVYSSVNTDRDCPHSHVCSAPHRHHMRLFSGDNYWRWTGEILPAEEYMDASDDRYKWNF